MVVDKLFEFIEDIERFCVNHRWSRFFNDWETGDEALDEYAMIYKNCCNDIDEEKDAANDIFIELTDYMDCLYNYIDVDCVKLLDDEKQNARKWLDKVEKVIGSCVYSLKGNDLKGFLIKGYQMCHLIKEAATKTPDEYYGGRRTDIMPYYIGESTMNKEQLFDNILNEADDTYKAKVNGKWLKGNKLVKDKKDADTFESKTEPTQRINQMKKDGKINKNSKPTIMKEYVSNQITNTFMRHGVEKYFHEYIIVVDDDWYTPCEFISENGLEDNFGPEYVFEQVVIAVKSSIRWLKNQGIQPDENDEDVSYNLWEMIDFVGSLKENTMKNKNQFFESLLQEDR